MVNLKIDHNEISVPEGTTIMEAAALAGIDIPKLCYLKDINEIAACRVCLVEVVGKEKLVTSCNNKVKAVAILQPLIEADQQSKGPRRKKAECAADSFPARL